MAANPALREPQHRPERLTNRDREKVNIMVIENGFTLSDVDGKITAFVDSEENSADEKLLDYLEVLLVKMRGGSD